MKRFINIFLSLCITCSLLGGCGKNYTADEDTLYIQSDGSVIMVEVQDFDSSLYDEDEFEAFAMETIYLYNESAGEDRIQLKNMTVNDNVATLVTEYASVADYTAFTGNILYFGTVSELKEQGIIVGGDFVAVRNKNIQLCGADEFSSNDDYYVVAATEGIDIHIPKKVRYVSATGVRLLDKETVQLDADANMLGTESTEQQESTEPEEEPVTESSETSDSGNSGTASASDGSASVDDLLTVSQDSTESEYFDFEAEAEEYQKKNDADNDENDVSYVFIIYK